MFNLISKGRLSALFALLSMNFGLSATECCEPCIHNRIYIGGFGGGIYSDSSRISQMGTAFFTEAEEGPLAVYARGNSNRTSSGFGGFQVGHEWLKRPYNLGCSNWSIAPAAELEAFFYSHNKKGELFNPTDRLDEHDFLDSFDMTMSVCLANAVFSLNSPSLMGFSPYLGGGIGATHISLQNANSIQIDPPEVGINHFNSQRSDSTWAFAAQIKAGLRYKIFKSFHIFAEYRYLFVDASNYILGSTVYSEPFHAPTSPWNVKVNNIHYNAFSFGIQYDL